MRPIRRGESLSEIVSNHTPTNGSHSFSHSKSGTHSSSLTRAHTAAHTRKQGVFQMVGAITTLGVRCVVRNLCAQRSEEHTLPSLHGPRERRREAESLRNGDAHRARLRSEAPRPRRIALLHCCFLRCTSKLRGSLSLRRRAERKIC